MEKEEKELLKKALCYYLPLGLKGQMRNDNDELATYKLEGVKWGYVYASEVGKTWGYTDERIIERFKPYLRPMSSMTEEEEKEYAEVVVKSQDCSLENSESATTMANDWLLSKGFDVRGVISKGLALVAPEGMYEY
jgi:hypothetical protein